MTKRLSGFKKESSAKIFLTHCWRKLDFKIASTIFCRRFIQTWISKTVHTSHPLGGFLFLVFLNSLFISHQKQKNWLGFARYMDHVCFHSVSTIIRKVQTLASTKNQRCIQSPFKQLIKSSSRELVNLPDPHLRWDYLFFVTANQVKVFSRNIMHSVTGFDQRNVQRFK